MLGSRGRPRSAPLTFGSCQPSDLFQSRSSQAVRLASGTPCGGVVDTDKVLPATSSSRCHADPSSTKPPRPGSGTPSSTAAARCSRTARARARRCCGPCFWTTSHRHAAARGCTADRRHHPKRVLADANRIRGQRTQQIPRPGKRTGTAAYSAPSTDVRGPAVVGLRARGNPRTR